MEHSLPSSAKAEPKIAVGGEVEKLNRRVSGTFTFLFFFPFLLERY